VRVRRTRVEPRTASRSGRTSTAVSLGSWSRSAGAAARGRCVATACPGADVGGPWRLAAPRPPASSLQSRIASPCGPSASASSAPAATVCAASRTEALVLAALTIGWSTSAPVQAMTARPGRTELRFDARRERDDVRNARHELPVIRADLDEPRSAEAASCPHRRTERLADGDSPRWAGRCSTDGVRRASSALSTVRRTWTSRRWGGSLTTGVVMSGYKC